MTAKVWALTGLLCLGLPGCVIGTWPTPEDKSEAAGKPPFALQTEDVCGDGIDNDGDGSVDEGCPCRGDVRGCVAAVGDQCGFGVQRCRAGTWTDCGEIAPPYSPTR